MTFSSWRRRRLTTSSAGCPPVVVGDRHNVENPLEQGNLTSQTSVDHRQDMQPGQGVRAFQDAPQNKVNAYNSVVTSTLPVTI